MLKGGSVETSSLAARTNCSNRRQPSALSARTRSGFDIGVLLTLLDFADVFLGVRESVNDALNDFLSRLVVEFFRHFLCEQRFREGPPVFRPVMLFRIL